MKRAIAVTFSVASCFLGAPNAADARPIGIDDFARIVGVSSPAIAPDGNRVAIVVSRIDMQKDDYTRDLDLYDIASHAHRTLTYDRHGLSDPSFSPDGTKLAFVADVGTGDDAHAQVWVMPLDGGDARPVTTAGDGVDQFKWSPDGTRIAYAAEEKKPDLKGAEKYRDSFVFTTEPITAHERPRPAHLFVIPATGGTPKRLLSTTESVATGEAQSTLSWSPDGTHIAFVLTPNAILNDATFSHVDIVDVASGNRTQLTQHAGFEGAPEFSPDGAHLAYAYSKGDNQSNLVEAYVTSVDGGEGVSASRSMDRAISDLAWIPDSSGLYVRCENKATLQLERVPLKGDPEPIDLGEVAMTSPLEGAIAKDGAIAFVGTASHQPPELYVRSASGSVTRLSDYNAATAKLDLGDAERITYPTSLGIEGDAVLVKPPGFTPGRRYPLAVFIHGGPTSASTLVFNSFAQLMAARGWLVLEPNYRGSTDLGLAYQRGVLYDPDDGPGRDIMAAVAAVRATGSVDEHRMTVSGWSYGGIMTAWMISKYHVWRAAVSGASVDDWSTDYGVADDSLSDAALFHGSPYVGDATEWRRASAISYVKDVTTPVLILSDVGDNRDPFATSSMYWRALRDNRKDATLRVWPIAGHFPHDPVRIADVYEHWVDYLAEHLGSVR